MIRGNDFQIIRLIDLLSVDGGEDFFASISDSFSSKNKDVEFFLKNKAVQSTKLKTSSTHLIVSLEDSFDILGYFTLAIKMLTIKADILSQSEKKSISRFGYFDEEFSSYLIPAILIAQLGKNFSPNSRAIQGCSLMDIALEQVQDVFNMTSGKTVFLECEKNTSLIRFYENNGFRSLNTSIISKNNYELMQMYRIL
ncbi:MAG: hypothetical protein IKW26_07275 [Treponema sp.]|nr:hypothetical protein [Treponema sp.]